MSGRNFSMPGSSKIEFKEFPFRADFERFACSSDPAPYRSRRRIRMLRTYIQARIARPRGRMRKRYCLLAFLVVFGVAEALPSAVRLHLCVALPCPHPVPTVPPFTIGAGVTFDLYVTAADNLRTDETYTGTIQFVSSDTLASLPANYTFVLSDRGMRAFTAVVRTPGNQTITVADVSGALVPGTVNLVVTGVFVEPIPTLSEWMRIAFGVMLLMSGIWLIRPRN
jgi:hypothetical protein